MSTTVTITSGSSWARPSDCPSVLDLVECWGGGQPGETSPANQSKSAAGGAGGDYSKKANYSIGSQSSIAIQIPGNTTAGNVPGDTWFDNSSTGVLAKSGGSGSTSIGDTTYAGGAGGGSANATNKGGAGGGGSASTAGGGVAGSSASGTTQRPGGAAGPDSNAAGGTGNSEAGTSNVLGGGGAAGGDAITPIDPGGDGGDPGGGGGGGGKGNYSSSALGGKGGRGQIRITYTPITNVILMMCEA